jgi:ABC-type nitrate/sulfonate/bicarbonate transport system ATPase subunit
MNLPVETDRLTKRYGRVTAVDGVSLTVRPGEVYGFLGPNGAGKTTTLRMLLGLVRPDSGTVRVFGRPPGRLADVGALIEGPGFYPYLSGRDNLRVLARYTGTLLHWVATMQRGMPGPNAGSLVATLGAAADTPGVAPLVGGGQATAVVAAYLVAFAVAGGVLLHRRDVL